MHDGGVRIDELEKELAKSHSTESARRMSRRATTKHARFSRAQLDEMTVRQLKRALAERGETFDATWVGRPDEKKQLVKQLNR